MRFRNVIAMLVLVALLAGSALAIYDASIKQSKALNNGAGSTTTGAIDTGKTTTAGDASIRGADFVLTYPTLTTTQLPDTRTVTYKVIMSSNSDLSSSTDLYPGVVVQTGAAGAGAAGSTFRFRIPSTASRYIGVVATVGASGGDCSGASMSLDLDFK